MTNINLTELEKKVLKIIKGDLECGWQDDDGNFTECWNMFYKTTSNEIKGALGSLVKKGIISILDCETKNDVIRLNDIKYLELIKG